MASDPRASLSPVCTPSNLLLEWQWLVPAALKPLFASRFGDLFLQAEGGPIYFLDTLNGKLVDAADNESELLEQFSDESLAEDILMPELEQQLSRFLGSLRPGECYGATIPFSLNGKPAPSNFKIVALDQHVSAMGKIQRQVAGDPAGTKYKPSAGKNGA
jgi:hypothetical protein